MRELVKQATTTRTEYRTPKGSTNGNNWKPKNRDSGNNWTPELSLGLRPNAGGLTDRRY